MEQFYVSDSDNSSDADDSSENPSLNSPDPPDQLLPSDGIPSDSEVAKTVSLNVSKTQRLVFTLHGEKTESKKKLQIYSSEGFKQSSELSVKAGATVVIDGSSRYSYCLEGLRNNTVVFKNKINHLMIRNSDDTRVYLNSGTISGIDILKGSNVSVRTSKHNFTNVEQSQVTSLDGEINTDTLIHVTNSIDVIVNEQSINANPFARTQLQLTDSDGTDSDTPEHNNVRGLSSSPIDRPLVPTKLFLEGIQSGSSENKKSKRAKSRSLF